MDSGLHSVHLQLRRYLRTVWQRRRLAVSVAWITALAAVPVVMLTPNRFEASARIYVDTQTVLKPLMEGLTYQPDIEQQVRMLARTVVSRPNVERLVDRPGIGLGGPDAAGRDQTVT